MTPVGARLLPRHALFFGDSHRPLYLLPPNSICLDALDSELFEKVAWQKNGDTLVAVQGRVKTVTGKFVVWNLKADHARLLKGAGASAPQDGETAGNVAGVTAMVRCEKVGEQFEPVTKRTFPRIPDSVGRRTEMAVRFGMR